MKKIVFISDTHTYHDEVKIPEGDILIHCGDFSSSGRIEEIARFNFWLSKLPHKTKIVVAGNHDRLFETNRSLAESLLTSAIYLQDSEIIIDDIHIYASPWQPAFCNWAFNLQRGKEIKKKWDLIPDRVDILVTHCPPYGILDQITPKVSTNLGCEELYNKVIVLKPKIHAFGHIHGSYGKKKIKETTYINASNCTEEYDPINKPITIKFIPDRD